MVEIEIAYEGGLRCRAAHGPSGDVIRTDAPVDNHGRGEAFSPTDLVAAALGACFSTIMGIVAERKGLDLAGLRVVVRKGMSAQPPRRIARLEVDVEVPLAADHPERPLLESAALACPVHQSLHPEIEVGVRWAWRG